MDKQMLLIIGLMGGRSVLESIICECEDEDVAKELEGYLEMYDIIMEEDR